MELNREQIIKALECCVKSECNKCPLRDGRCANGEMGRLSLSLIKELNEENEELLEKNSNLHAACWELRADTVRKMQTEIKKTFSAICKGEMVDLYRIIDQIAKEMLEEGK